MKQTEQEKIANEHLNHLKDGNKTLRNFEKKKERLEEIQSQHSIHINDWKEYEKLKAEVYKNVNEVSGV